MLSTLPTRPFLKAGTAPRGQSRQQREFMRFYSRYCLGACGVRDVDDEKQIKEGRHREQDLRGNARQAGLRYSDHVCEEGS